MELQLDHLVVAASTLEAGVAYVANALGLSTDAFSAEGKHTLIGTHNRLLGMGGSCYLEVIAVDPQAPQPARRRWFALDDPTMRIQLAERPRLLHWVARVSQPAGLEELAAQHPWLATQVIAMTRGPFSWHIGVPEDGSLPCCKSGASGGGLVPTLIQWDVPRMPAQTLPHSGIELRRLAGTHPQAEAVRATLAVLNAGALIHVESSPGEPALVAEFDTPLGVRILT